MNVRILSQARRGRNVVMLIEQRDEHHHEGDRFSSPPLYLVTLVVWDRAGKPQGWARTDFEADVARELYDVAIAEFISAEPV